MKLVMWASDKAITDEAKRGPLSIANSSKAVYKIMQRRFLGKKTERMIGLFVDVQMQILSDRLLFTGTVSSSYVYIRDILKIGLDLHASGVILVHNHPAGNPTPSSMDKDVTDKVTRALRMVEMDLLDHVIIGQGSFYSMKENGDLLPYPNILAVTGGTS
jgi:DNA repair protein RadC